MFDHTFKHYTSKHIVSDVLLMIGFIALLGFGAFELSGWGTQPLVPATAALLIGCTAVLDRVGEPELE